MRVQRQNARNPLAAASPRDSRGLNDAAAWQILAQDGAETTKRKYAFSGVMAWRISGLHDAADGREDLVGAKSRAGRQRYGYLARARGVGFRRRNSPQS
jgi:hypothetical protein